MNMVGGGVVGGFPPDEPTLTRLWLHVNPPRSLPLGVPLHPVGSALPPVRRQPLPAAGAQQGVPRALVAGSAGLADQPSDPRQLPTLAGAVAGLCAELGGWARGWGGVSG